MENKLNIAVVDDHSLFRNGMVKLIQSLSNQFKVVSEAGNGQEFLNTLKFSDEPDVVLLDISMPILDGFGTAEVMQKEYPNIHVLVISMNDDELSLIRMLKLGVKGFIGKDIEPEHLKKAIESVGRGDFYHTEQITNHLLSSINGSKGESCLNELTKNELKFIELACSEDSYKDIAACMCLSPRTIDGYRDAVFSKLNIKSRVGLVMYAIKNQMVVL
jgi:DNA-binding NarL/FixJ family response regulator